MFSNKETTKINKHIVIFIIFFLVYLIVCYFHFRWEKYYDEYFAAAYDPYQASTIEVPHKINNAIDYFNMGVKSSISQTKIEYFSKAIELNPKLASAYEERGLLYFFQEKYNKAISDYNKYIEFATPKAEVYQMLGLC